jgi:DNA repair photolyase
MEEYKEISCKSACIKTKRKMPYKWDLNIYRGCGHKCKYCYALYSHKYLESNYNEPNSSDKFFDNIYVKTNIAQELDKQLAKTSWKNDIIAIGTVTDSYQPIEKEYELMPEILKVLIKHKNPAIISTKSKLILRDLDLINELSEITYINIAGSVTSMDSQINLNLEPNAALSNERIAMLKKVRKETNASCGLHFMPIIPYLTDSYENIDVMFKNMDLANVHYTILGPLNLYGQTRRFFFNFLKQDFPHIYKDMFTLYKTGRLDKQYKHDLFKKINKIKRKYNISTNYMRINKEKSKKYIKKEELKQSNLFDFNIIM